MLLPLAPNPQYLNKDWAILRLPNPQKSGQTYGRASGGYSLHSMGHRSTTTVFGDLIVRVLVKYFNHIHLLIALHFRSMCITLWCQQHHLPALRQIHCPRHSLGQLEGRGSCMRFFWSPLQPWPHWPPGPRRMHRKGLLRKSENCSSLFTSQLAAVSLAPLVNSPTSLATKQAKSYQDHLGIDGNHNDEAHKPH